jgi:hypothetical protein
MKRNTTNQIFSFFLAENQRPTAFQKELQMAKGIINQSMSATFGNIAPNSPRALGNRAVSRVSESIVCSGGPTLAPSLMSNH